MSADIVTVEGKRGPLGLSLKNCEYLHIYLLDVKRKF